MKMGILEPSSNFQNCIKKTNKIPEYARDYKNEYLFIIGLNKEFHKFEDKYENHEYKIYESKYCKDLKNLIKRFLRRQEYGYLKDISSFIFKNADIFYIKDTYSMLKYDLEMFTDDELSTDDFYSGFSDFYELFCKFYYKINIAYDDDDYDAVLKTIEHLGDPRNKDSYVSDSDSDDDLDYIFNSDSDSD